MTSPIVPQENQQEKKSKLHKKSKTICKSSKCLRHALNVKTKCCSYRCERALRRKLHTYKLRPNGEEDPEIIDVSHILSSCKIKSPNKLAKSSQNYDFDEELRPKNYLFKMARRKHKVSSESESVVNNNKNTKSANVSSLQNGKITMYTKTKSPISNGCISADVQEPANTKNNGTLSEDSQETAVTDSQKKNKTNAFKLLMDSRNKSIGSNSPGKEKIEDPTEIEEIIVKKTNKAKRNLALQKLAEAKGALKNREKEEQEEKVIQRKMEKRAERLKEMIANAKPKHLKKDSKAMKNNKINKIDKKPIEKVNKVEEVIDVESSDKNNKNVKKPTEKVNKVEEVIDVESCDKKLVITKKTQDEVTKKAKALHLVDIFKEVGPPTPKTVSSKKFIPKEDVEFLQKLSPSIKKKENMMCYFKKIEKKSLLSDSPEDTSEQSPVIKVKVSLKNKKKLKKRKLSLNKDSTPEVLKDLNENSSNKSEIDTVNVSETPKNLEDDVKGKDRRKRKRKENSVEIAATETIVTVNPIIAEEGRPKRNVKKPMKYVDDIQLTSSDEELHIFTPRKKRLLENKNVSVNKEPSDEVVVSDEEIKPKIPKTRKTAVKDEKSEKKPVKLAPIFAPKPQLNTEQLEAKQKFLYSGVPEQIKKMISQQKKSSVEINNEFPVLVHVQQISQQTPTSNIFLPTLAEENVSEEIPIDFHGDLFKKIITLAHTESVETQLNTVPTQKSNTTAILNNIKNTYPKFPVYRTYRTLKSQSRGEFRELNPTDLDNSRELMNNITDIANENPDYLNWTEKYKATSTKHLIGNFESVKEMKKWLTNWTDNEAKTKAAKHDSDSSDFCYDSDSNSRDCIKSNNLLVLTGPSGCGKTSSVYAVAAELAIKVIEVNASSKRTGKMMLQDLQEATQSHKVNRAGLENSQKIPEVVVVPVLKTYKKRGRPKKSDVIKKSNSKDEISTPSPQSSQPANSQENVRTGMSLILVDDADIVFDQDDGFSSAISQLIQSSKRPVILVTGSLSCPHLQRFLQCGKVIQMSPFLPRMLGTWLDLMCLADKGTCWPGLGARFLDYFKGDIRKTINCLQFHMTAHLKDNLDETSQNNDTKLSPDEESSNISWPDSDGLEDRNAVQNSVKDVCNHIMHKELNLQHVTYPEKLFNVWWSIPSIINNEIENGPKLEAIKPKTNKSCDQNLQELNAVANLIDAFSVSDLISNINPDTMKTLTSEPWYSSESDSVSELESLQGYNRSFEVTSDILQNLVTSSIGLVQTSLQCEGHTSVQFPSMTEQRARDRILDRHEYISDMMNPSAVLDRRGLALDYWSTCRSICRIEKNKNDTVLKRNNRFCHYLRSSNAMARNETFDYLADCLNCEEIQIMLINDCGYCHACLRKRLNDARGRKPEPYECAYKHILESYSGVESKIPETPKSICASCRWTSDAQFPETPPSLSDLSLEWSSRSSTRSRTRRRKR